MHAKISLGRSIGRVLYYHELKMKKGQAEILAAGNFLKEAGELTYRDKLYQFERLVSRNDRADKKVLQVFVSFGRDEKVSNEQMAAVGTDYLQAMGFAEQPWLIYRHHDTSHPHAHLVSTTIRPDGNSIQLRKKDFYDSRNLTHALEEKYGLEQASWKEEYAQKTGQRLRRVKEGEGSVYPSVKLVLDKVLPEYRYTTLDELNAVLGLYNVQACRGREGSEGHRNRGLYYRVLGDDGAPTGHYFRAGAFDGHPGIGYLEARFAANQAQELEHRRRLAGMIDYALLGEGISREGLEKELAAQRISVVGREGLAASGGAGAVGGLGALEGTGRRDCLGGPAIFYVDHLTKEVCEGRRLGERYSAEAIERRCIPDERYEERLAQEQALRQSRRQSHGLRL